MAAEPQNDDSYIICNSKVQRGKSMKEKQHISARVESCHFGWFFLQAR